MGKAEKTGAMAMLIVLYSTAFITAFNENIINVALIDIMNEFSISETTAQWLVTGYMIVTSIVTAMTAYLMQRFSTRSLFFFSLGVMLLGLVPDYFVTTFPLLLTFRILQAAGSGIAAPLMLNSVLVLAPRNKLGTYLAAGGAMIALGPAFGPVVSGVMATMLGWRAIFIFPALAAVVLILAGTKTIHNVMDTGTPKLDIPSVVLMTIFLTLFVYGVGEITVNLPLALGAVAVSIVALVIFVFREKKLENPLLNLHPMKNPNFWPAALLIVITMMQTFSMSVLLPLYFESVFQQTALVAGMLLLPPILVNAVTNIFAGRAFDKWGEWPLIPIGLALILIGQIAVSIIGGSMSMIGVMLASILVYCGVGISQSQSQTAGLRTLPGPENPHGVSIISTLIMVSASIGPSLFIGILSSSAAGATSTGIAYAQAQAIGFSQAVMVAAGIAAVGLVLSIAYSLHMHKIPLHSAAQESDETAPELATVMKSHVFSVNEQATVREVARLLVDARTSGVPVVDTRGHVVGFVSDGDIMRGLARQDQPSVDLGAYFRAYGEDEGFSNRVKDLLASNVMEIATKRVESVEVGDSIDHVCDVLRARRIKKVPVLDNGQIVGTVSRSDIVRYLMDEFVSSEDAGADSDVELEQKPA
ncbi:MAG: MFS transporter [Coriobacteriales bacterium]|jgi:DHA2 family lincomycin resistance protein-like MFS transporter